MAEAQIQQSELHAMDHGKGANLMVMETESQKTVASSSQLRGSSMMMWFRIGVYTIFVLCGQTAAGLLTRLYYEKGGRSKWVATLVQVVGFPILLIFYYFMASPPKPKPSVLVVVPQTQQSSSPLPLVVSSYIFLGLLTAGDGFLYSVAFQYLPVSTVTLIAASQLAFNAFFSYFLNAQKFTALIANSLILLTISSVLLVVNNSHDKLPGISNQQYVTGVVCAVFAAIANGLLFATQQFTLRKVLKRQSIKVVMDLVIYEALVACIAILIGFFASGDWRDMKRESERYETGKTSYAMTLAGVAVTFQVFTFGTVALIFEASALFSNAIGALALPLVPILARFIFHDSMNGTKIIALVLAVWGFISYAYQHYLDHKDLELINAAQGQGRNQKETSV